MNTQIPTQDIKLMDINPSVVNLTIKYLKKIGVPFYSETNEFDIRYPYLYWYSSNKQMSQSRNHYSEKICNTADEFISNFEKPTEIKIKLNDKYTALVTKNEINVGCQTFTKEVFEDVYNALLKLNQ